MSTTINRDEWLAAVREVEGVEIDQAASSLRELGELFGLKKDATRKRVEAMVAQGRAVQVFKRVPKSGGSSATVPAYRLVKATKRGK